MRLGRQKATSTRRLRRRGGLVALMLTALLLSACQADFDVMVEVEEDGSGLVTAEMTLDGEAGEQILDPALALTDLAQSGWEIGRPVQDDTGATTLTAAKAFGTPEQFSDVMNELARSDDGIIQRFVLRRDQSFGRVDYAISGVLDPSGGLASFSDPDLDAALGRPLVDLITSPPYNVTEEDITITVGVELPGDLQGEAGGAVEGDSTQVRGSWPINLGSELTTDVSLNSTRRSTSAQVLRGVAVVAGVLAALIAFGQLLRLISSLRRPKSRPKVRPTDARGRPSEPAAAAVAVEPEPLAPEDAGYRVVALDGHGVLYKEGGHVHNLLIPFAREFGSTASDEEIEAKVRLLNLGRLTTGDFWAMIGVAGDANELDSAYVARHQLMPGVVKYLRSIRDRGVRVACITDDSPAWAMKLRAAHSLEALVEPWVVSGSVGVAKPDAPVYEVLRRVIGEPASTVLIVDDDLDNLDMARHLGFGTAWFNPDGERSQARDHDLFRNFDVATDVIATTTGEIPSPEVPPVGSS